MYTHGPQCTPHFTWMSGHAQSGAFPWKKLYKKYKPNWSSQHEKQCAKIDKVTPECLLKKKGLFCPCSPFSIDNARCPKVGYEITRHILLLFILAAEIFNQLNNPVSVWKPASTKHHHCVLSLHPTDLYVVATSDLWHSGLVTNQGLVWSPQKRQDKDIPGRGWQQFPLFLEERARDGELCWKECPALPCLLAHGGAGVWDDPSRARLLPAEDGGMEMEADGGMESPQGFPQVPQSVVQIWGCKTHMGPLWLWAKLYRTCCRHHEAARPPPETAACKYQHCQWQLRLGMDCTCFP